MRFFLVMCLVGRGAAFGRARMMTMSVEARPKSAKMGYSSGIGPKTQLASVERCMEFQTKHNLWPEPIRDGTTSKWHPSDEVDEHYVGTRLRDGHTFDTVVAAISADSHLFAYGLAHFDGAKGEPGIPEAMCVHVRKDGLADDVSHFVSYARADASKVAPSEPIHKKVLLDGATIRPPMTIPSEKLPDEKRTARMRDVIRVLVDAYGHHRRDGDAGIEATLAATPFSFPCDFSSTHATFPIQRTDIEPGPFVEQWGLLAGGDMRLVVDAYAGHHPVAFAKVEIGGEAQGIIVAEFDEPANKLLKLVVFRDFLNEKEQTHILL